MESTTRIESVAGICHSMANSGPTVIKLENILNDFAIRFS